MWRYDGCEECKKRLKQIKKTSILICLIFLCHKLIIKMHCIGTSVKSIFQKLADGMNHPLSSNY